MNVKRGFSVRYYSSIGIYNMYCLDGKLRPFITEAWFWSFGRLMVVDNLGLGTFWVRKLNRTFLELHIQCCTFELVSYFRFLIYSVQVNLFLRIRVVSLLDPGK